MHVLTGVHNLLNMPHFRKRDATAIIKDLCGVSPIVGILGHRQVGKTTLLEEICENYTTFDSLNERESAELDPVAYVDSKKKLNSGIDECQLVPQIFPALKEAVRKDKRPGHFILSGSVRFTARKDIHESLTGRMIDLELLPFTVSELNHLPLPDTLLQIMEKDLNLIRKKILTGNPKESVRDIERYNQQGGLPDRKSVV